MSDFNVLGHINRICEKYGWTYYRLAQEADIPYSTITNMAKRNTIPSIPTLERICFAFGITLADFFAPTKSTEDIDYSYQRFSLYWSKLAEQDREMLIELAKRLGDKE